MAVSFPAATAVIRCGGIGLIDRAGDAAVALLPKPFLQRLRGGECVSLRAQTVEIIMTDRAQTVPSLTDIDLLGGSGDPGTVFEKWLSGRHALSAQTQQTWTELEVKEQVKEKQQGAGNSQDYQGANHGMRE